MAKDKVTCYLDPEVKAELEKCAKQEELTISQLIRKILRNWLLENRQGE